MADGKLVFLRPASGSGKLVFGDAGGSSATPDASFSIDAEFAGEGAADLVLRIGVGMAIDARLDDDVLPADVALAWDANAARNTIARASPAFQQGQPLGAATRTRWQRSVPLATAHRPRFEQGAPALHLGRMHWQRSLELHTTARPAFQQGLPQQHLVRGGFQQAIALRTTARPAFQQGLPLLPLWRLGFQQTIRLHRVARSHFQTGTALQALARAWLRTGAPLWRLHRPGFEQARYPLPGLTPPYVPPVQPPDLCYDPARLGLLVFRQRAGTPQHGTLFFICTRAVEPPGPPAGRWIIPVLEVYMSAHNLSAVSMPSLEPVVLLDASIESDDGGFCWALSATGREHLMDQLAPVAGLPARVRVTVDGHAWVFAIERISRTRRFGQHRAAIQGRSLTALVGDPYFPAQDFASAADITAHQALIGALDLTGVGITWDVADWLMPGGVWQYNGTPLAAALRLAESAGNVLRSHATDAQLIMAPGYTAMPWDWASATPDVSMPADIILTDSLEPDPSPEYNAVYVSGQQSGMLGHVVRTGTAGDLIAPPVTDPYITHAEAARMRGQRILGAAGRRMTQTITAPFLTDAWAPGPILPGYLVQVTDIAETWRGLVRGIRINASMTTVRQQITIERRTT